MQGKRSIGNGKASRWAWLLGWPLIGAAVAILVSSIAFNAQYGLYGDSLHYNLAARDLLIHHFYTYWGSVPDAQVTPGYPLFVAFVYRVAAAFHQYLPKAQLHTVFVVQAVLAAMTCGFLYWIALRALRPLFAAVAGLLWAVYPPVASATGWLLTETLFVFCLCGFVLSLLTAMERKRPLWWGVAGLALGVTVLVRPTVLPLLLIAPAVWLWQRLRGFGGGRGESSGSSGSSTAGGKGKRKQSGDARPWNRRAGAYVVGGLIALVPWWVRNYVALHQVLLTDDDAGNPLLAGIDPHFAPHPLVDRGLTSAAQEKLAIHITVRGFASHPLQELTWYTVDKTTLLFAQPWINAVQGESTGWLAFCISLQPLWVVAGGIGLLILFWTRGLRLVPWITLYLLLVQLPFLAIARYAFPLMPFFMIGVAALLQAVLYRRWPGRV